LWEKQGCERINSMRAGSHIAATAFRQTSTRTFFCHFANSKAQGA